MAKKFLIPIIALMIFITPGSAKEVAGVEMPESFKAGNEQLVLNGAGLREKYSLGVDIYIAGLYLKNKSSEPMRIINSNESMAIKIRIVSGLITPKKFIDATIEGFNESIKNLGINRSTIEKEIDQFNNIFMKGIEKNDVYDIVFTPAEGVQVFKNGETSPSAATKKMTFKRALWGIWLTERSDTYMNTLRQAMLGK